MIKIDKVKVELSKSELLTIKYSLLAFAENQNEPQKTSTENLYQKVFSSVEHFEKMEKLTNEFSERLEEKIKNQ